MKFWDLMHFEKCGWYLDCSLKSLPTYNSALRDFIQPALKGTIKIVPFIMDEDVAKMPKKKSKPKGPILLIHDNDDNAPIQSSLNNHIVTEPFSSNLEAMFHISKRQKTTHPPTYDMPPKLRGMMDILPPLPANHTSLNLILNDFFVRIIKDKKQIGTFYVPYDDIVAFLSNVSSFYFTVFTLFKLYKVSFIFCHVISFFAFNCRLYS